MERGISAVIIVVANGVLVMFYVKCKSHASIVVSS
jgi:hypothetical protein